MFTRRLLGLSSLAVTAICVAAMVLARLGNAASATAMLMCSLVWAFALYLVAQKALNENGGFGRVMFPIALALVAAITLLPQFTNASEGDTFYFVPPVIVIFAAITVLFAVSALLRTEGKSGWLFTFSSALVFFGIAFLPVGIWFLRPRVAELLER